MLPSLLSVAGVLLACSCCVADEIDSIRVMESAVLTTGPYFSQTRPANSSQYGDLIDVRLKEKEMVKFHQFVKKSMPHVKLARHINADGEGIDCIEKFFWGQDGGIVLELGTDVFSFL